MQTDVLKTRTTGAKRHGGHVPGFGFPIRRHVFWGLISASKLRRATAVGCFLNSIRSGIIGI